MNDEFDPSKLIKGQGFLLAVQIISRKLDAKKEPLIQKLLGSSRLSTLEMHELDLIEEIRSMVQSVANDYVDSAGKEVKTDETN